MWRLCLVELLSWGKVGSNDPLDFHKNSHAHGSGFANPWNQNSTARGGTLRKLLSFFGPIPGTLVMGTMTFLRHVHRYTESKSIFSNRQHHEFHVNILTIKSITIPAVYQNGMLRLLHFECEKNPDFPAHVICIHKLPWNVSESNQQHSGACLGQSGPPVVPSFSFGPAPWQSSAVRAWEPRAMRHAPARD